MQNPAGYVFLTDEVYINDLLENFKTDADITMKKLQEYFGHKIVRDEKGGFGKTQLPLYFTSDEFLLKKGTLPSVKKDIQTSVGLYIFNVFCLNSIFGERVDFYNPAQGLTPGNVEGVQQIIVDLIIENKATGKEFSKFQTKAAWIGYKGTLWNAGQSFEFAKINPEVAKEKPILIKRWKEEVARGADPISTYVVMVEKPLLAIAKKSLKKHDAWPIYARGGKPKIDNVYKNCTISMGPVYDPITGTYVVAEDSFMDGINNNMIPTFANIQVDAGYNRAVATQDGGAKTKQIFAAMQSIKLNPKKGFDCGSKRYVTKTITNKNFNSNYLRYIIDPESGKLTKLTKENFSKYNGKTVKMRSPTFCHADEYCNICAGDYFLELGLVNIGNATTRMSSTLMNKALKAMHDVSVDADFIDPFKYMQVVK
ncbi:MAG: hypothetical protein ACRC5M_05010 [Anaeroplasmataceae bacterium]